MASWCASGNASSTLIIHYILSGYYYCNVNPFKPEFTIVIFIYYKSRIACGLKIKENCHVFASQYYGNFRSKTLGYRKIKSVFEGCKMML